MSDIAQELRQRMADAVNFHIKKEGLTGVKAAKMVGMSQSRMSKIVRGDLKGVTAEFMAKVLGAFGYRLESYIGANEGSEFIFSLSDSVELVEEAAANADIVQVSITDNPAKYTVLTSDSPPYTTGFGLQDQDLKGPFMSTDEGVGFDPDFDRIVSDEE